LALADQSEPANVAKRGDICIYLATFSAHFNASDDLRAVA
jgi:hypothetical protein